MRQSLSVWLDAARPKTLPLAFASIATGSSVALFNGHFSFPVMVLALLTAILLQILSNLANDYGDAIKGTDNQDRIGPTRAIQSGAVTPQTMKQAIIINIILTVASGLALIFYALQTPTSIMAFIGLGLLAIIAAIAYTVGNKPYGYIGLGDLSVFIFFGLLGVAGTFFLHTGFIDATTFLPSVGCGLLAVAVLNINNMRDIENDAACGKRTMAVRLGAKRAKRYHMLLLTGGIVPFIAFLALHNTALAWGLAMLLAVLLTVNHGKAVLAATTPTELAPMMPVIVKCALVTNLLFSIVITGQTLMT
ncbi:1,4-dihydroxy-2-naphthoate polyprenyltransferase [Vibrio nigripulchritudo]|uniref:1,4-dihydroxy-2-naphthoate polyprenyltransferase n=1 Tax=Vibrio nigripulchritudo TaxID=28173 RepID=UPI0003B1F502|nr:1,4-dihydroxy-2-naphthoate polyprenyltransferase [Vibrio nigripulchritudo]CCN70323.1 1,4-dihydroxy-2-naphthoate octaprenyltransferase [Vibrio nigripulchritudo SFn118]